MNKFKVTVFILLLTGVAFSACNRNVVANKTPKQYFYTCPMHQEIYETKAGNCTKCGMKLEQWDMDNYSKKKSSNSNSNSHSGHSNSGGSSGGCH